MAVFLTASLTEGPYDFTYDCYNIIITGDITHFPDRDTKNSSREKHNFSGIVFAYQCFCFNFPASNYSHIFPGSWSPRNIHLPAKSDRAPPGNLSS